MTDIRSAPLWNSSTQAVVGMLTVTDFINILRHYHYNPGEASGMAISDHQIQSWRGACVRGSRVRAHSLGRCTLTRAHARHVAVGRPGTVRSTEMDLSKTLPLGSPSRPRTELISVQPAQTLLEAASLLIGNRIHRIPLVDRIPVPASARVVERHKPGAGGRRTPTGGESMSITPSSLPSGDSAGQPDVAGRAWKGATVPLRGGLDALGSPTLLSFSRRRALAPAQPGMETDGTPPATIPLLPTFLESVVAVITQFKILRFIASNVRVAVRCVARARARDAT